LIVQITDQGLGIPEAEKPFLFEPFHRGRNVSNIPGTGLGLNIVKQFVELLRGTVMFDSTLGVGTTFTVRLPM
jgi:signal transduction histidine kinase